ncbi:MAG TPA: PDZ domain-containing protein, partial [Campylobacterales bacterium]|nr:PDZ domain-containing protein [Campylobacterales bacterium]
IGNPFGVGQTVTQGIVSALNKYGVGINQYENFIQTDASINPGNSGGALIDSLGALIGINSAILSRTGGNHGIGFSIPVDMVKNVVSKLVLDGEVQRGFMGVNISKVTDELKDLYSHKKGAIITNIQPNSPADKAELQRGDLIYAIDGKRVKNPHDLQRLVTSYRPDETIKVSIERDGKELEKTLILTSMYGDKVALKNIDASFEGLYLNELNDNARQKFQIPSHITGILIEDVEQGSAAYQDGFVAGDVLIQIENRPIASLADATEAFTALKGKTKRIYINRRGAILLVVTR